MIGAMSLVKVRRGWADTEGTENTERINHRDTETQRGALQEIRRERRTTTPFASAPGVTRLPNSVVSTPSSLCLCVSVAELLRELCFLCVLAGSITLLPSKTVAQPAATKAA